MVNSIVRVSNECASHIMCHLLEHTHILCFQVCHEFDKFVG